MVDYRGLLSVEQQGVLPGLREMASRGEIGTVSEYIPNGYLRSYSVGLTPLDLPEVIIYGLSADAIAAFFEAFFEQLLDPSRPLPNSYLRAGTVSPKVAARLVPVLSGVFPDGFELTQIVWPDGRGLYPTQRGFDKRLEERQPRFWDRETLDERLLPPWKPQETPPIG